MNPIAKEFSVLFWGSHPDEGNDDCWYGEDFETLSEALVAFNADAESDVAYVELDGPEIHRIRKNEAHKPSKDADLEWQSERRWEAAMLYGVRGWNDA